MTLHHTMHCRSCGTANRIPADKEGVRGRCGACKAPLPPLYSRPLSLDDAGFEAFVASFELPVLEGARKYTRSPSGSEVIVETKKPPHHFN